MTAPYCPLPGHDQRRAYIPADRTDITKTWDEHRQILVCGIGDMRDDYELVQQQDWMSAPGGFK